MSSASSNTIVYFTTRATPLYPTSNFMLVPPIYKDPEDYIVNWELYVEMDPESYGLADVPAYKKAMSKN